MANAGGTLRIQTGGRTVTVNMTDDDGSSAVATVGGSPVAFPTVISSDTTFVVTVDGNYTVSALISGVETYGKVVGLKYGAVNETIAVSPTKDQADTTLGDMITTAAANAAFAPLTPWAAGPSGWDAAWKAARSAAGTTPATVAFIGDSTSAGQNSGDVMAANWVELLANDVAARYGRYADFYPMWTYCTRFNTNFVGTAPYSDPGAASGSAWEGGYGRAVELAATFSTVFTPPKNTNVIGFDLIYLDFAAGTFTAFPDSASPTTITTTVASSYTSALIKKQSFTGLTPGAHTLTINGAAGHFCIVVGVTVYYAGGTGIGFARSANNGGRAVDLATPAGSNLGAGAAPSAPTNKILAWAGGTAGPTAVNFDGIPGQPVLVFVGLILNDGALGSALVPYKASLIRLVKSLRRGNTNCSICFLIGSYPDNVYSDVNLGGNGVFFHRWKSVIRDVASSNACAVVDIDSKWMSKGLALGYQGAGDLHPTAAGYADIYNTVKGLGV